MTIKETLNIFLLLILSGVSFSQSYVPEENDPKLKVKPVIDIRAYSFHLSDVKLLNGPFRHAMQMDSAYLLLLEPDRLLYRFYKHAGLPVKDSIYGGWESEGLSGHTMGHYLSACSMMYASTGNSEFKARADYIIDELEKCQKARKTGYIGAIPDEDSIFGKLARGEIHSSGFNLNGGWSPWYTVHKLMAGLVDAYLYAGNRKAIKLVLGMADWTFNTVYHLPDSLRLKMLDCEYGGMNEVLANIYSITGDRKYLNLSYKFYDEFVMGKLAKKIDPMPGKHSNTNIPKAIGSARQYELTGNERDKTIASFFWHTMVHDHSYVIGGNSNYEYCGEEGKLNDRLSDNTCETCNTYNILKLTRHLFAWQPSSGLIDFYERALYNHILASQSAESGMMCYFVPLRMGARKAFSDSFNTFTCCVGTGMENHSKYAEQIYGHGPKDQLYVNLFIPSVLNWKEKAVMIRQETSFPESGKIKLTINCKKPVVLTWNIRKPIWCSTIPLIYANGQPLHAEIDRSGYLSVHGTWKNNDVISVEFPMYLYTESMPDNPDRIAFMYGPIVLAGLLGNEMPDPVYGTPVLMTNDRNVNDWLRPAGQPLQFRMEGAGKPFDVTLVPFYQVDKQYYSVYWDYFTLKDWDKRQAEYEAEQRRQGEMEERTIDNLQVGEVQAERDHNLSASERSYVTHALGRSGREARSDNYFTFDVKVLPGEKNSL